MTVWLIGFVEAKKFSLNREDQIVVAFAGSQKTLMVGLAIAFSIGGLAIIPMLAYHVEQLLIDTVLAGRLRLMAIPAPAESMADGQVLACVAIQRSEYIAFARQLV